MTDGTELERRRARLSPAKQAMLAGWLNGSAGRPAITRRAGAGPAPLSFSQERLWFLEQLRPGTKVHHLPAGITLTGPLDRPALERAFNEILRRHEVLRARFPAEGGEAVQVVDPHRPLPLGESHVDTPFDLATGNLVRTALHQVAPDTHRLTVLTHHIVSDARSYRLLVRELASLYAAYRAGKASPLPELPLQYADFAAWDRAQPIDPGRLEYWQARLDPPVPVLEFPSARPRPATPSQHAATHRRPLSLAPLRELGQAHHATPYMVVLAGLAALLHRYTGRTDVTVGTPVAGRDRGEVADLIGFFANTVVMRVDTAGDPTFGQLLAQVRETTLAALSRADVPFAQVVQALRRPRDANQIPLFQVQLVVQDTPAPAHTSADVTFEVDTLDAEATPFDLSLVVSRDTCRIDYSTDLFDAAAVAELADHLATLLGAARADPDRPLSELAGFPVAVRTPPVAAVTRRDRPPYGEPRTGLERTIAGIWRDTLDVDQVGRDDSFFTLGGHSALLIRAYSQLCDATGRSIDVIDVFAHPTPAALAEHLGEGGPADTPAGERVLPFSPEQDEIWQRHLWAPQSARVLEVVLRLRGDLDRDQLERALGATADRHPALRAQVDRGDGAPGLRVAAAPALPLSYVDISRVPAPAREQHARDLAAERLVERFPPDGGGPRWRAVLIRLDSREHLLAVGWDELIADGRSREVIVGELLERYRAGAERREPVLPEAAVSLDGYLAERRAWLGTAEAATAVREARTALLGARPLPLRPGPASRTFRGKRLRRELPAVVVAGLRDVCGRLGVTSYQCLVAAVSALLARYTGQSDVVVTTNVVNRTEAAHHLVGNFTTAILPRLAWTGDPPYPQLLHQVRAATVAAQERQRVPAASVLGRLGWDDYRQLTPAGQVSVQVLRRSSPLGLTWPVPVGDIEVDLVRVHLGHVPGDLGVEVIENDAGTALSLDYNLDVFAEPEALRLRDALDTVLARVVAEPDRPLSTLLSGVESQGSG